MANGIPVAELVKLHTKMLAGTISPLAVHVVTGRTHVGVDAHMQMELRQVRKKFEQQMIEAQAQEKRKLVEVKREAAKVRAVTRAVSYEEDVKRSFRPVGGGPVEHFVVPLAQHA